MDGFNSYDTEYKGLDTSNTPAPDYSPDNIPEPIKRRSTWVRGKNKLIAMREALGQGLEVAGITAFNAERIAQKTQYRQDAVEDFNNQMIIEMTDKDVISAPEIIMARNGEPTLAARLEVFENNLSQISTSVKLFGAVGDGVTNDTNSIQNAIDSMDDSFSSVLLFPKGVYIISGPIYLKDNISIKGDGATLKVVNDNVKTNAYIVVDNCTNVNIYDLDIDLNYDRVGYDISERSEIAILIQNSKNISVIGNTIKSIGVWSIAVFSSLSNPSGSSDIRISGNKIYAVEGKNTKTYDRHTGYSVDTAQVYAEADDVLIEGNYIHTANTTSASAIEAHGSNQKILNNTIDGFIIGIYACPPTYKSGKANQTIHGNIMNNVANGILLWPQDNKPLSNVDISKNLITINMNRFKDKTFTSVAGIGIAEIGKLNNLIEDIAVSGNTINFDGFTESNYTIYDALPERYGGVRMYWYSSIKGLVITGNRIKNAPGVGICVGALEAAEIANYTTSHAFITNNTIVNTGKQSSVLPSYNDRPKTGIRLKGSNDSVTHLVISENVISDDSPGAYPYYNKPYAIDKIYSERTYIFRENTVISNYIYTVILDVPLVHNINLQYKAFVGSRNNTNAKCTYVRHENYIDILFSLSINQSQTSGNNGFLNVPVVPSVSMNHPIAVVGSTVDDKQWYLELTAGSVEAKLYYVNSSVKTYLSKENSKSIMSFSGSFRYFI